MIFLFPDYDTLQLAITSAVVPPAVSLSPVLAGVDEANHPWLQPTTKLPRTLPDMLRKLGAKTLQAPPSAGTELVNWLQAIPMHKQTEPPQIDSQAAVLFALPDANQLPVIVQEMLRLSNDRQSFRWLQEDGTPGTVLLRVIGPPYYTLLRAIDKETSGSQPPVRAYVEGPSRVWVQIGYTHPLAEKIQVSEGQMLLLRAPDEWVFLNDAPFRDIYDILQFQLPSTRLDWEGAELKEKLSVPLRLIEGDARDAELWVLHHNAIDQLDALVRDAKESLVQRLIFAVGQRDGEAMIALRVRPSKQPPPQLVLDAQAYSSYLKLPNLFVPVGTRLHPALRRDAIRKLLAEDPAQINWLVPSPEQPGSFTPEYLQDDAFRPLSEWVDYVLDHDRLALTDWVQRFRFDFDPFVCKEETTAERPKPPPGARRKAAPQTNAPDDDVDVITRTEPKPEKTDFKPLPSDWDQVAAAPPAQLQVELEVLQKEFLALGGGLDAAERLALWPELAWRLAELKNPSDAAICWLNRIWEVPESEPDALRELVGKWAQLEKIPTNPKLLGEALDRLLFRETPSASETRALVTCVVWGALQRPVPVALMERLPRVRRFLEQQENSISVRAVWLGWYCLSKLAGYDALALARVRDRLLDRLIHHGLNPEHDLPHFLRAAGHHDAERLRVVRTQADRLHALALAWYRECENVKSAHDDTSHYVDLVFSFGFARLGETTRSRELLKRAQEAVALRAPELIKEREAARLGQQRTSSDEDRRNHEQRAKSAEDALAVDEFLLRMFRVRIEQVLNGHAHHGHLPADLREELDRRLPRDNRANMSTARYGIDRMREQSDILDPQEEFEPYRDFTQKHVPPLERELVKLQDIRDPKQLSQTVARLWREGAGQAPTAEEQVSILAEAMMLAPRVGDGFALELLNRVEPTLKKVAATDAKMIESQAVLLERALLMAANYDRAEIVQRLMPHFVLLLDQVQHGKSPSRPINRAFRQCLRSLRKLGLRDDIGELIDQSARLILQGQTLAQLQASAGSQWPGTLQTLLYLAGGWMFFGWQDQAAEILDAARMLLTSPGSRDNLAALSNLRYSELARTYVEALGHAQVDAATRRIESLFQMMRRFKDTFTSNRFYARLHLNVIEAVVMSVVTEEFAIGPGARRWLDDDEYLVRRRIHRDHKAMKELTEA